MSLDLGDLAETVRDGIAKHIDSAIAERVRNELAHQRDRLALALREAAEKNRSTRMSVRQRGRVEGLLMAANVVKQLRVIG